LNLFFSVNNYVNEVRIRKNTDRINNELVEFIKQSPKKSKYLFGINQNSEYIYQIEQFNEFYRRRDISLKGYQIKEQEIFTELKKNNYNYLVVNRSKNVYFNRIVWNTGLTLENQIKTKCPLIQPIKVYQYNLKGLMFGKEDNLPYYYFSLEPNIKDIKKAWLIYNAEDLSLCLKKI